MAIVSINHTQASYGTTKGCELTRDTELYQHQPESSAILVTLMIVQISKYTFD